MTTMKREPIEITLAGERHKIEPLSLDQLQNILSRFDGLLSAPSLADKVKAARDLVAHALSKESEELGAMFITLTELLDACDGITKLAGLEDLKNRKPAGDALAREGVRHG